MTVFVLILWMHSTHIGPLHWPPAWKIAKNVKCFNLLFNSLLLLGNSDIEMGIPWLKFRPHGYMYFLVMAQILAIWVLRVDFCYLWLTHLSIYLASLLSANFDNVFWSRDPYQVLVGSAKNSLAPQHSSFRSTSSNDSDCCLR